MNPMGHGVFKALREKRRCPHCKREQMVASDKKNKSVACKVCGKSVPPPRKD